MESSPIISLFAEPVRSGRDPISWLLSSLSHSGVIGIVSLGLMNNPKVLDPSLSPHYSTRLLSLRPSGAQRRGAETLADNRYRLDAPGEHADGSNKGSIRTDQHQVARHPSAHDIGEGPQLTLLQPDVDPKVILPNIPLPSFVLLSVKDSLDKLIVPPGQQVKSALKASPQLDLPNAETNLSDINILTSALSRETQNAVLPSTTSPVVISGSGLEHKIPETTTDSAAQPTSARVISLSDIRMAEGTVAVPRATATAKAATSGDLAVGQASGASSKGTREGAGARGIGPGTSGEPSSTRIIHPKNGKFGIVVVGASLEELYPETAEVWKGRLAYTVYLHLGLAKSWILQYSQPRSSDVGTTEGSAHIEAPWPTDMVVPNIVPGSVNADAVLVHGFLNRDGHFERMAVIFPQPCALAAFIMNSLQQWQFRPAMQNGKAAMLEVLLVIPED